MVVVYLVSLKCINLENFYLAIERFRIDFGKLSHGPSSMD